MSQLRRLLGYLGPYRRDMVIGAALVLAETCFELLIPVLMADLIDVGVANRDMDYILSKGVQMAGSMPALPPGQPTAGVPGSGRPSSRRSSATPFPIWTTLRRPLW